MDHETKSAFKETIFSVISERCARPFADDCSIDFFPKVDTQKTKQKSKTPSQKVYYAIEGLSYLETLLGKGLFNPDQNILVARRGRPYPIMELTQLQAAHNNEQFSPNSPQRKLSKRNIDNNQNNINEKITDDIYGSPLKLQAIADLSSCDSPSSGSPAPFRQPEIFRHIPVGLSSLRSRQLISLFCVNFFELMSASINAFLQLPSFWCMCDRIGVRSIVLIGSQPVLSTVADKQWGLKQTVVTQVTTDDILSTNANVFKRNVSENRCFARYDLVEPTISTAEDRTAYQGSLSLEFQWKNGTKLLQKPEFYSEAVIKASVSSGDVRSPAIGLFEELTILKSFMSAISTREIDWAALKGHAPLLDMVKELIENLKLGDAGSLRKIQGGDTDESPSDQFKLKERLDYDFTDYLWKILITCSSYSDLTTSLNYIFKALGKGEFQPAVHQKNKTMMAQFIRDSYTGRLIIPHLGGIFPLKLVVEMGIETLRCDYVHAFVSQDLTTPSHLEYFLQADIDLEEKISRMEKMHYSMEMVVMIHLFLQLPYSILGTCARKMLKYFETQRVNMNEVFEFPVETRPILPVVKDSLPSLWSLTVEKKIGDLELSEYKVWTLTTRQPFVHLVQVDKEHDEIKTDDNATFFLTFREDSISILN